MLLTVLVFVAILSILVLIHELGHFFAAKRLGIRVEEFGFGLPPKIFGVRRGETEYSLNWLPIGGFVRLYGEEGKELENGKWKMENEKRAFYARPPWQRAIVLIAGVSMNFILALVLISYLFTRGVMVPTDRVHIEKVVASSPAVNAGLKSGDVIKEIRIKNQELRIKSGEDLVNTTKKHLGEEMTIVVERKGKVIDINVVPRKDYPKNEGPLGVVISNYEEKKYSILEAPIMGMKESVKLSWVLISGIGMTLYKLISFQSVSKDVAGPIGIAQMTGQALQFGGLAVLELMGLLSLNLAIVNILPFPALDGGRLLFVVIEAVTGKRIRTHWERYVHQVGMAILLALILLVTLNDLVRIFAK